MIRSALTLTFENNQDMGDVVFGKVYAIYFSSSYLRFPDGRFRSTVGNGMAFFLMQRSCGNGSPA